MQFVRFLRDIWEKTKEGCKKSKKSGYFYKYGIAIEKSLLYNRNVYSRNPLRFRALEKGRY